MNFIILLLAYFVRRRLDASGRLDLDALFRALVSRAPAAKPGKEHRATIGFLMLVLVFVSVLALDYWLRGGDWSPMTWPLDFVVLLLTMGLPGWRDALQAYGESWRRGDMQAAWHHVSHLLTSDQRAEGLEPEGLHCAVTSRLLAQVFERYFLVVFWFVLLGPAGAVVIRLCLALRDHWPSAPARPAFGRLIAVVAWVPVRLLAISFGLAGDLGGWLATAKRRTFVLRGKAPALLFDSANGALSSYALDPVRFEAAHPDDWPDFGARSLSAVRDLLNRSFLVWICVLALLAIAGIFN
ncbi:MAG: histidine kinase [Alteromonadaceae bacterium]|nr:histidine kinase [Alteromonadaceae bacterium]MBH86035.1 histidine kinase [Alteromonadaceae bacterium]|tara:strand:- start:11375 stop:12265 length:891 start_codon:yes stop_codon:yes gene_type:complete